MGLLETMKFTETVSALLSLLFGVIIIMFIVISILLIYSLLMISVETKEFQTGVLRLIGMSKLNCISMIIMQSMMFVLPSILLGYILSIPTLFVIFKFLFKGQNDVQISALPDGTATVEALLLGLIIPLVSSIIPI
jgi:ABC-type antimicrobial peptide transport system permease subunit